MAVLSRGAVGGIGLWSAQGLIGLTQVIGVILLVASALVVAYAGLLGLVLATIRVEIAPDELIVVTALGRRRYRLASGELRRLHVPRRRSPLAVQVGFLGVMLGQARLAEEELAGVVALAPVDTLILVPTVDGRIGIAPRSESELVDALEAATRR